MPAQTCVIIRATLTLWGLEAAKCDVEIVKALIEGGDDITTKSRDGHTRLMRPVIDVRQEAVEVLLLNGADIDCKDNEGDIPLIWAVQFNNPATARLLLQWECKCQFQRLEWQLAP